MRSLHRLMSLCMYAFVLFGGAMLFSLSLADWAWRGIFMRVAMMRWVGMPVGAAIFVFGIIWMLGENRFSHRNRFLSFRNEGGAVNISTAAISEYLEKLAASFPSIVQLRVSVEPVRRKVDLVVSIRIKAGPQLHEICEVLQKRMRESMESGLGIQDVRHVIVRVKEISGEHRGT